MEAQFEGIDFEIHSLKSNVKRLEDEKEEVFLKVDDLENRVRRNNLVFHGIPEPHVDREDCNKTVKDLLSDFVGVDIDLNHIDRCYRILSFRQALDPRPCMIHVAFSSF